jgi:hypothetical protein
LPSAEEPHVLIKQKETCRIPSIFLDSMKDLQKALQRCLFFSEYP